MSKVENIVIIGGGPAGLAAAVYNSRANLQPLVFAGSPAGGQLTLTTEVENFPGFESILGPELIQKLRAQATKFGTRIFDQNVLKVDFSQNPFKIYLNPGATKKIYPEAGDSVEDFVSARTVIIATGAKALWLGLESETRLRGKGVSACATCDGFFFRNKEVAVVGGGDTAMEEALVLTRFATKVHLIHRRDSFRASKIMQERVMNHEKINVIWNTTVEEVLGEQKVEGLRFKTDGKESTLKVDALFLAIGHKPDTDVFKGQVELDEKGYVVTKGGAVQTITSIPGVFAAGDNVDHTYRQAATAAGMGVAAALEAERWIELSVK